MLFRLVCLSFLLLTAAHVARAQNPPQTPPSATDRNRGRDDDPPLGSPHAEMLDRAMIRHLEESHKETVERAKENAQLGAELRTTFKKGQPLNRDDLKKLERMEKLARSIRGRVGGSDNSDALVDPPRDCESAVGRLAEVSEDLRKNVEKTSRHVVSTSVIEGANRLLQLIRVIRGLAP
ncbi:MAG TPA: hypothetical protein VEQ42_11435 [Pyrinomonadaceae bacterium]|nr:hypothetical protein [Pyrinomonadaceae bacterium]